jgi:hypothetical protein
MAKFSEIMEARGEHEPHSKQWHVGWLGQTGAMYPVTTHWRELTQAEPGGMFPLYMDAGE